MVKALYNSAPEVLQPEYASQSGFLNSSFAQRAPDSQFIWSHTTMTAISLPTLPVAANEFLLRPGISFLNHGSFGACPRPVFDIYQGWQRKLEEQPVEFLGRQINSLLAA